MLKVSNLTQHFPISGGILGRTVAHLRAVDGVSFEVGPGETLGLVGESGCGKTTLGKSVIRLYDPTSGSISFEGKDITRLSQSALRPLRKSFQMVFQDPAESLNQRLAVGQLLEEPFVIHDMGTPTQRREWVRELLGKVGLPATAADRYPFEFSGGQRQRIGLARAIALRPKLIVLDEPVSALDVSVQSQILNLLMDLQQELGLSYLFISHDLSVIRHICDRIAVMYLGKIVETGPTARVYERPTHPYTRALLSAIPQLPGAPKRPRILIEGDIPSPIDPPPGCAFGQRTRCVNHEASKTCDLALSQIATGHSVAACPCALKAASGS